MRKHFLVAQLAGTTECSFRCGNAAMRTRQGKDTLSLVWDCLLALPTSNLEAPEPQHLISSIIAIIYRGMYGLRGWILIKHAGNA